MTGHGSTASMGGTPGSGYGNIAGFNANTEASRDVIFNEVEDTVVAMTVMKVFHKDAYNDLITQTDAADRMGKTGTNTYTCTGYCAPQHTDNDICKGCCFTIERKALPGEYAFCMPSYGYYTHTYDNTFW
ncbi:hypothetical protein MSAN_00382100 [Mycena sanguinolenta]|uniref:Uncharacterized protein n=1 Tax=Mycena sanguinolenta TaxID=230812 RepID=A0A8H6ZG13_9AGAR|nr:hypothetical protein MSAN_00382100 [Mycena sanguinolenta]